MRTLFVALLALPCLLAAQSQPATPAAPSRTELLQRDGIIWGSAATWGIPYAENLPEDVKIAGLSRIWFEVKINFPNFSMVPDLDWDRTYLDFIPQVRATTSTYDYYKTLQRFVALLHDGHSNVFLPDQLHDREVQPAMRTDLVEGRVFITGVDSRSLASLGIAPGLEILEIDHVPVHEYAATRIRPFVSSNSPQHVEELVYTDILAGPVEKPVALKLRQKNGSVIEKDVPRTKATDATPLPAFEYRQLAGNVAYVALNSFNVESVQTDFEKALPDIRTRDALIIDVRANTGGSGAIAYNIIGYLVDQDFFPPLWKTRQYIATQRAWGEAGGWYEAKPRAWAAKPKDFYGKPVVMLTGPQSLSATDVFAETFKRLKRGSIVGEPTGGSTGDPLGYALPGGGAARVSTSADVGTDLVGRGVQPDVLVPRTVKDFLSGRDAALEAALVELKRLGKG